MTLEEFARHGMALLVDSSLKSLILLAAAGLALLCLRRASAAVWHLVVLMTLVGLLCLPLFSSTLPGWQVAIWPTAMTSAAPPANALSDAPAPAVASAPPTPSAAPSSANLPSTMPPAAMPVRPAHPPFSWPLVCLGVWALGVGIASASLLAGVACVQRIGRMSGPVESNAVNELAHQLLRQLGVCRKVSLRQGAENDRSVMPMTWGWRHPIILLPADSAEWSEERLRVVLLHEFAHILRSDWLWQMLAHLACAAYWFHPGVWLIARQLRIESERACDDQVLAAGVPATDYARNLVEVARSLSRAQAIPRGALPMATSQVEGRVRTIIQSHRRRGAMTKRMKFVIVVAAAALLLPLAMLRPAAVADKASLLPVAAAPDNGIIVVVDAGHGGKDTGMVGIGGVREKDIDLAVALKLRDALTKKRATVIMTRTDDTFVPLMARPALIKPNHAQYFISIHCAYRWPENSASGVAVYYHGQNVESKLFAKDILENVRRISAMPAYGVHSDISRFRTGFGVLRASSVPAILVECGSLNNAKDAAALRQPQTQQQIADAIAAGIDSYKATPKIR